MFYFFNSSKIKDNPLKFGNKGVNLSKIAQLGISTPKGFIITTELFHHFYKYKTLPANFNKKLLENLERLEKLTEKKFGDAKNPLLVSVRSGSSVSMPGMMNTILNLGINDAIVENYSKKDNYKFMLDNYARLLEMYGSTVYKVPNCLFKEALNKNRISNLSINELKNIIDKFKQIIIKCSNEEFAQDINLQLAKSIESILKSWQSPHARAYRNSNQIDHNIGTAIIVQEMVFGNLNDKSLSGILFSRNPSSGDKELYGEYFNNSQGEDIASGSYKPNPINSSDNNSLSKTNPKIFKELSTVSLKLENHFLDMQDIEFTVENDKLYILQTRNGKRSARAAVKIVVDMVKEEKISKKEAIEKIDTVAINQLLYSQIDYSQNPNVIGKGIPVASGVVSGPIVFSSEKAEELGNNNPIILVREDTSPEDIKGIHLSAGVLTSQGGATSHAAVITRGLGKPCICGANFIFDKSDNLISFEDISFEEQDILTIDGNTGNIIRGDVKLIQSQTFDELNELMEWVNEYHTINIRCNAETALDAKVALQFGASGIGLCRTEHMFFSNEKLSLIRCAIIATNFVKREEILSELFYYHKHDFQELFKIMKRQPINIRLLDPPLHEFLPKLENKDIIKELAQTLDISVNSIQNRIIELQEKNPMLGNRGCRIGITYPEIYIMQIKAIFSAAIEVSKEDNDEKPNLEIMVPFISTVEEMVFLKDLISKQAEKVMKSMQYDIDYKVGTMIELPRIAVLADKIAKHVDYFSFGTNDLTQSTYGISRDDISSFLPSYIDKKIFHKDPFASLDEEGVGELIRIASKKGRKANKNLKMGICGEHGGNTDSVSFYYNLGFDYISCSPYRIMAAKLAAVQAFLRSKKHG